MKRREFCRQLAAAAGTAALLQACRNLPVKPGSITSTSTPPATAVAGGTFPPAALPTTTASTTPPAPATANPTPQPTRTPQAAPAGPVATIALVRTTNRAEGVQRALALLGVNPVRGNRVLLKPNLNSADPAPASTHPEVLRALLLALEEMGARAITIGERSGMGVTGQVMQQTGVTALAAELGWETAVFDDLPAAEWVLCQDSDYHWADGFAVPKMLLEAECVVQTCNLKTHRYGGHFTLSLKNSVGFAAKTVNGRTNYMTELHNSPYQRQMIAEINHVYKPGLIVLDGVEAFLTGGPDSGSLAQTGVVLAGTDRIALDAVGVALLRLWGTTPEVSAGAIFDQAQIARAVELGLGISSPAHIQFVTADEASQAYAAQILSVLTAG